MDKRVLLAVLLAAVVLVIAPILFPTPPKPPARPGADSARAAAAAVAPSSSTQTATTTAAPATAPAPAPAAPSTNASAQATATPLNAPADTLSVTTARATYRFSSIGAAPVSIRLADYRVLTPGRSGTVDMVRSGLPAFSLRLVTERDTIALDRTPFAVTQQPANGTAAQLLGFRAVVANGDTVDITYAFAADSYVVRVGGAVRGPVPARALDITLPAGLASAEADTLDDQRHLGYVVKPASDNAQGIDFGKVDPGEITTRPGPFTWVASKSKYFVLGLLPAQTPAPPTKPAANAPSVAPFGAVTVRGGLRPNKVASSADATVRLPLTAGARGDATFAFTVYAGPQEWERLRAMGYQFDETNPYGGWLRGIVQPFAGIVIRALLWLHRALKLSYGWVLVAFAVAVRLILWPLNQRAMRSNLKMQRLQPQMQEIQKRYKTQPEKQQAEIMKLYQEHNMSPFSMFSGCLPLLLPWPVFIALFFVFQNTIEFRGVPFLWMHDISLRDPYFILPILMAASVFLLSWIGLRGVPDNPQARTMAYVSPVMMLVLFFNIAGGLNLYYLVQNLVSLPQQWFISRERAKLSGSSA